MRIFLYLEVDLPVILDVSLVRLVIFKAEPSQALAAAWTEEERGSLDEAGESERHFMKCGP